MSFELYIRRSAVERAEKYFQELAQCNLEGMGLLVGSRFRDADENNADFLIVSDFVTSETNSSSVSVKFSRKAFEKLSSELKHRDEIVVGWCHSHPSYGCFLSSTDVSTQRRFFNEDFHVASVFDPLRTEQFGQTSAMAKRFYRLHGNGYSEVSFAVF